MREDGEAEDEGPRHRDLVYADDVTSLIAADTRGKLRELVWEHYWQVETLLANESFLQQQEEYLQIASLAAQTAAKTSWDRYQRGVQGIFDTLDSQRRSFDAKSRLLSSQKQRIFNRIQLFVALGLPALPAKS